MPKPTCDMLISAEFESSHCRSNIMEYASSLDSEQLQYVVILKSLGRYLY